MKKLNYLFLFMFCAIGFSSCDEVLDCEDGIGTIETRTLELESFDSFTLDRALDVTVLEGPDQKVEIEGHGNLIDAIKTDVSDNHWKIDADGRCFDFDDLKITITLPSLKEIKLKSSGDVFMQDDFTMEDFNIDINGSGDLYGNGLITANKIDIDIDGSGDVQIGGTCTEQIINITGSGKVNNFDLITTESDVKINASGSIEVNAIENLDVKILGSGSVYYRGYPAINVNISGSGKLVDGNL